MSGSRINWWMWGYAMSDNLTDHIAKVLGTHGRDPDRFDFCLCGWHVDKSVGYGDVANLHRTHVAAAVVEKLGLTQEWVIELNERPNVAVIHQTLERAQKHADTVVRNRRKFRVSTHDRGLEQVGDDIPTPPTLSRYVTEWVRDD